MSDLQMEKINADRINRLEEKVDRQLEQVNNKLDRVLEKVLSSPDHTTTTTTTTNGGEASWVRQSIGITLGVIALIGLMVPTVIAIVKPISQQIEYLNTQTERIESRAEKLAYAVDDKVQAEIHSVSTKSQLGMDRLDEKLQIEIGAVKDTTSLENSRNIGRIEKLEEWQKWWYREMHPRSHMELRQ